MARACSICGHAQRADIDAALVNSVPFRALAEQFRVGREALRRHADRHLPAALVAAQEAQEVAQADGLYAEVREVRRRILVILDRAEQAGDLPTALKAIRELRGVYELLAKLEGQIASAPTVNVMLSPQWSRIAVVLLRALAPFPDARVAAADALAELEHHAAH